MVEPVVSPKLGKTWFVLQTWPQAERVAVHDLADIGYVTYLPLTQVRVPDPVIRSMHHLVKVTKFRGYLFILLDRDRDPLAPILKCGGVRSFIHDIDGRPLPVEKGFVETHQAGDAKRLGLEADLIGTMTPIPPGATINVNEGALAGRVGTCVECDGVRTFANLVLFGRRIGVELDRADVSLLEGDANGADPRPDRL